MRHLQVLVDSGVSGVILCGSLGENQALDPGEKREVIAAGVKSVGGEVPVLSGVAEPSTSLAIRYVRDMEAAGADGVMLMPAMSYKGDPRETMSHFDPWRGQPGCPS